MGQRNVYTKEAHKGVPKTKNQIHMHSTWVNRVQMVDPESSPHTCISVDLTLHLFKNKNSWVWYYVTWTVKMISYRFISVSAIDVTVMLIETNVQRVLGFTHIL